MKPGRFLLFLFYIFSSTLVAQTDSIKKVVPVSLPETTFQTWHQPNKVVPVDTNLQHFQNYQPSHQPIRIQNQFLGNLGMAHFPLVYQPNKSIDFDAGFHQFDSYLIRADSTPFYNTNVPFTDLFLLIGTQKEVMTQAAHAQNLRENFYMSAEYARHNSEGIYNNQTTSSNAVRIASKYESGGFKRYQAQTAFSANSLKSGENGGVTDTTIFENQNLITKNLVDVTLENAETHWNHKQALFRHSILLGKKSTIQVNDSTTREKFDEAGSIFHEAGFLDQHFRFMDPTPDSSLYGFLPLYSDSLKTGTHVRKWSNALGFCSKMIDSSGTAPKTFFQVAAHADWVMAEQGILRSQFVNYAGSALWRSHTQRKDKFFFAMKGKYIFSGGNQNDYGAKGLAGIRLNDHMKLSVALKRTAKSVPWNMTMGWIEGNTRSATFEKVSTTNIGLLFQHKKWNLKIRPELHLIENHVYWNTDLEPVQLSENVTLFTLYFEKLFQIKQFHLDNFMALHISSHPWELMKPKLVTQHTMYYENVLFKGALMARIGFDIIYNTDYSAPAYSPLYGVMHRQQERELHYYPVIDVFLSVKVKRTRIFAKYEHLSQGLFSGGYYGALNYPMADRAFKAGVSWKFVD